MMILSFSFFGALESAAQVRTGFSRHAVNTSLYAYHPLSLRMIVLKTLSGPVVGGVCNE